jgi:hypothetical protein
MPKRKIGKLPKEKKRIKNQRKTRSLNKAEVWVGGKKLRKKVAQETRFESRGSCRAIQTKVRDNMLQRS